MNDLEHDTTSATDLTAPKRPWHAPKLEEVDYSETEAGAGAPIVFDGPTTYTS